MLATGKSMQLLFGAPAGLGMYCPSKKCCGARAAGSPCTASEERNKNCKEFRQCARADRWAEV
ncbi:hypothetical protein Pcac1_g17734 [Phytophthora cactorum]|uniref:Uncharacterized protein n=1 Tax=Phytophthora cactorum TaxID=29920 RepID=A0A8T0ZCX7_9STRA|nr:hypothetical protein Pcac1_g17734 [Phytophthora cactorum]KAG2823654.1 hypothetical protein PC111_g10133 [Phytophthora cactorum]KAG2860620.1 hypothetical protein PC113_g7918 [Phytophthora cactorum]KAG2915480.1 hypothetical protein PC114_g7823 [Phytophthora cactorum]KAG2930212.1 hypothetical protein PC115_g6626 [Phytophthora cactorum]